LIWTMTLQRAAGQKIICPLLVLWGAKGSIPKWYDAVAIWRDHAAGPVTGSAVSSGHYLAEEAPRMCWAGLGFSPASVSAARVLQHQNLTTFSTRGDFQPLHQR
jgi:hypothetical protein